ncbi:MAG: hypothetical protein HY730_08295 [Candidatus Tectomicrobia bacterium]|uniref:Uncharacterized protein n=1 Tax=Tectimicrobiota bacterium TaxID=2528274 RepID=A0A933GP90_UNCTE|nr:hypothetical protein [Candidatus Tectomicrobia bacterium]
MKKFVCLTVVVVLAIIALMSTAAFAGSSSKFAAQVSSVALVPGTTSLDWTKVLSTSIKTPNKKDLLIGASFETGLYTKTVVKSSMGALDTSTAVAGIKIMVTVDGVTVSPGEVIYDKRAQTLSAKLGGILTSCQDLNQDGIIDILTECTFTDEEIGLILDTMAAHHFNFVAADLNTPGDHSVEVWARIDTLSQSTAGLAEASALVGKGSLTVEEVKATNAADGIVFLE